MGIVEDRYVTEKVASEISGLKVQTLRNHRYSRKGIPYVRVGRRCIRYSVRDIFSFMEKRKIKIEENQ